MKRRQFLIVAGVSVFLVRGSQSEDLVLLSREDAQRIRRSLTSAHREAFEALAAEALKAGPWSVTYHRPQGHLTGAGPNDYFSEGPYWWPDPQNPSGPYIRHDGERNPGRFMDSHRDMDSMSASILALGIGAFFLNRPSCSEHANLILSLWFADPATRMNPNLEHGQAIRGINDGRGTGLIDTTSLIRCVQGLVLLEASGGTNSTVMKEVRNWFHDFLAWMTTSRKGLDEKKSGNNHATWWAAQAAAYASFLGDKTTLQMIFDEYRTYLVPSEIKPDGSCPREEARTNSLSYSCFNLDAFTVLCRLAQVYGVDLWHFKAHNGGSLQGAIDYLLPFVLHPETWHHQQIGPFVADSLVFPGLAGFALRSSTLLNAYQRLPHAKSAWSQLIHALVTTASSS